MLASVVIRTLNEARYLDELLGAIASQDAGPFEVETIVVDSGSTDGTLEIAERRGARISHIRREDFSFGRSLNQGCEAAEGSALVMVSGHCVPVDEHWLRRLCEPLAAGQADYTYGRQLGGPTSHWSECRIFGKYFPEQSQIPQDGFFCNNANSAISRDAWLRYRFNEELTGLEDMELAQRLWQDGGRIGYVADASVYHHHSESWPQIRRRFEREALALQKIMPHIHLRRRDTARYILSSIWRDWRSALTQRSLLANAWPIACYRYHQYTGSYRGNHDHRRLSHQDKEKYFYPE
jgi:rhamnosyltransferase